MVFYLSPGENTDADEIARDGLAGGLGVNGQGDRGFRIGGEGEETDDGGKTEFHLDLIEFCKELHCYAVGERSQCSLEGLYLA